MSSIVEEANKEITLEQKESIKLTKNTKGYGWEIKILEINPDRLQEINNQLISKFSQEVNNGKRNT